jgi:hypothetical protein
MNVLQRIFRVPGNQAAKAGDKGEEGAEKWP